MFDSVISTSLQSGGSEQRCYKIFDKIIMKEYAMEVFADNILKKRKNGTFQMFSCGFSKGSQISYSVKYL